MTRTSRTARLAATLLAAAGTFLPPLAPIGAAAGQAQALPPGTRVDVSKMGPQVGDRVPDFRLTDQTGRAWTRESIAGQKGTMLVFFRSADW